MKIEKGLLKELDNDDFVMRFVISPKGEIKITFIFIYATREYLIWNLDISEDFNENDKKKIADFFEREVKERMNKVGDRIFEEKEHYCIHGSISRREAKKNIKGKYSS